ncbi:MAG: hypothetical protein HPY66_1226 [Firmicutes bacterium]|nr:hypothetical protein [Bacillota bacterium]
MKEKGLYVYGFVGERIDAGGCTGIDRANSVGLLRCGEVYAVVSEVDLNEFGHPYIDENLENIGWLKDKAELHMEVLNEALKYTQVIPLKFCTIFYNEDKVNEFAQEHKDYLTENLSYLRNKEEWSCKVYWDKKSYIKNLVEKDSLEAEEKCEKLSKGTAYFMRRKLEKEYNERAIDKANIITEKVLETLKRIVLEVKTSKILAKEITGRMEDMLLNCALLIDTNNKEGFLQEIDKLGSKVESKGLIFEVNGPWPPYNFIKNLE